ncbi:MAG: uroporphyrinogen-III C-methyltransferase [Candidatus Omnitrophica bacterium]|nr:uroporphyrinogen-III C-methyltransferase [Candidatus Omnitrophota bacterium]
MPITQIKVGSRKSPLALAQVLETRELFKQHQLPFDLKLVEFDTAGDKDKRTSLTESSVADDFFTDSLDQALLNGAIDLAIHSAKDLPKILRPGLKVYALTASVDETDCLVAARGMNAVSESATIGTSSEYRRQKILGIYPKAQTVDIRGTIQERIAKVDQGQIEAVIVATIALKRLGLEDRITEVLPWESTPLQGQLALVGRADKAHLLRPLEQIDLRARYGNVYLIGAGPGDPELITVKGRRLLGRADCVLYDFLVDERLLDFAPNAEKIYVGKRKGEHSRRQEEINSLIRQRAQMGKTVVRLKGGDPLIFGRGADEMRYLKDYHIPVEIIPGVSSTTAIPSLLGLPLTARDVASSVAFVTAHLSCENKQEAQNVIVPKADTLVYLMGLTKLHQIVSSLLKEGWSKDTPILIAARGTRPDQQVFSGTLEDILERARHQQLLPPSLIIVGNVIHFWKTYGLNQPAVLFTGTNPGQYQAFGEVLHLPMVELQEAVWGQQIQDRFVNTLKTCDAILLTSRFGVKYFFKKLSKCSLSKREVSQKPFWVIGDITAKELQDENIQPAVIANTATSEGLFSVIKEKTDLRGKNILFPRSVLPNPTLKKSLESLGARVTEIAVYENKKPDKRPLPDQPIQTIIFTSPSTVDHFLDDYQRIPEQWQIVAKGPKTAGHLKEKGYHCHALIQ